MKHLTDKSGISLTNIQFSIYKVAVWLTNLHLVFQFSVATCPIYYYNTKCAKIQAKQGINRAFAGLNLDFSSFMCYNICIDSFNGIFDSRKRGKTMAISYKKLWKLLIDKDMKKKDLQQLAGISSASITKLGKNENVNTEIIEKICVALQCDVGDIMEMTEDD